MALDRAGRTPDHRIDLRRRELLAVLAALGTGCSVLQPDPLQRAPDDVDVSRSAPPVVFIHGTYGARLRRRGTGREVWPGGMADLLLKDYGFLAVPLDPETALPVADDIEAYRVFDAAAGVQFYGSVLEMLRRAGRYVPTRPGTPATPGERRQYVYLFDWRRDYADTANGLDGFIEQLRADHRDPSLKVDIVAHSSGGLIARLFLLYGATPLRDAGALQPTFAGAAKVRRFVTLGTPELGMAQAAASLVSGEPIGLRRMPPEVLATAASCLQLLPAGFDLWVANDSGVPVACDAFDIETWRDAHACLYDENVMARVRSAAGGGSSGRDRLELLRRGFECGLRRARRVTEALWVAPLPASVPHVAIAGDCRPTLARLVRTESGGDRVFSSRPSALQTRRRDIDYEALMLEPGDGEVTRASALASPLWPSGKRAARLLKEGFESISLVCAQHNQLVINTQCQREILRGLAVQ